MKSLFLCATFLGLGLVLMPTSRATNSAPLAHRHVTALVDDPPPEPVDCPLCGGNAMVHAKRLMMIQKAANVVAARVTSY